MHHQCTPQDTTQNAALHCGRRGGHRWSQLWEHLCSLPRASCYLCLFFSSLWSYSMRAIFPNCACLLLTSCLRLVAWKLKELIFLATNIFPMSPCSVKASPHCALEDQDRYLVQCSLFRNNLVQNTLTFKITRNPTLHFIHLSARCEARGEVRMWLSGFTPCCSSCQSTLLSALEFLNFDKCKKIICFSPV